TLVLVTRPEKTALREAAHTSDELKAIGVANQYLLVNGIFKAADDKDETARAFELVANSAMKELPEVLESLPLEEIPLFPAALLGIDSLRGLLQKVPNAQATASSACSNQILPAGLMQLTDQLEQFGPGVIMTMGKGGVGKTSVAAAIAVELARRGHQVHLSTTDPAAHVSWVIESPIPLLTVSRIDPAEETRAYQEEVMKKAGAALDAQGKALLEEDLRSPCTEEVAVFRSFANIVAQGKDGFVVLDTAPTGHTILLLDAAQAYHREVLRQSSDMPESVSMLLPRLRDPGFTHVLIVTLPEATPVHEAKRLQTDLRRAGIEPFAWVINQSLSPVATKDPVLMSRKHNESQYIQEVSRELAHNLAIVPWLKEAPTGASGLSAMLTVPVLSRS
ncbi:MAG: arsenical pump-driving ATPase, partial [Cyanobacteria bacterium SZAS TMP-1]|nr:arsenical pump-driving ATPase [Cyanobacteria bacterium SZAS TMP-1]